MEIASHNKSIVRCPKLIFFQLYPKAVRRRVFSSTFFFRSHKGFRHGHLFFTIPYTYYCSLFQRNQIKGILQSMYKPGVRSIGGAPSRIVDVVAESVQPPVLPWSTLYGGENRGTDLLDESPRSVDLRQSFFYVIPTQPVPESIHGQKCWDQVLDFGEDHAIKDPQLNYILQKGTIILFFFRNYISTWSKRQLISVCNIVDFLL